MFYTSRQMDDEQMWPIKHRAMEHGFLAGVRPARIMYRDFSAAFIPCTVYFQMFHNTL
jgi:hypothetical protein